MAKIEINENFCFSKKEDSNIRSLSDALKLYEKNLKDAIELTNLPIFLDTNVLFLIYNFPLKGRKQLLKYYQENISRIWITKTIENEYINKRTEIINTGYLSYIEQLSDKYKKDVENQILRFYEENKSILFDEEELNSELHELTLTSKKIQSNLTDFTKRLLSNNSDLIFHDEIMDLYKNFNIYSKLDTNEMIYLSKEYSNLIDSSVNIPGSKDQSKGERAINDFLIYNELMKYAKENDTSIIFLTEDKKEDWFDIDKNNNKNPRIKLIEVFYLNTNQIIYILEAKRTLKKKVDTSFNITFGAKWKYEKKKEREIMSQTVLEPIWLESVVEDIIVNDYNHELDIPFDSLIIDSCELTKIDFEELVESGEASAYLICNFTLNISDNDTDNPSYYSVEYHLEGTCDISSKDESITHHDFFVERN